ncbi:MAG: pyrroline-5-carboxylate reductase [Gemmataceae bacterium]|nr:pyrroline-5-carboxylate reductase [Gemmataceae bacterium]MCI0738281.1 pyrroline-5-carboxylate reductase [Gemmataceae bacterium]
MSNVPQVRIGFVGAGKMATALARGWLQAGLTTAEHLQASDPIPQARNQFAQATAAKVTQDNRQVVSQSDLVVLATKPQSMPAVLAEIRSALTAQHLILSIAAGVSLAQLSRDLGPDKRIVRVMPNTPCLVGASASGYAAGTSATTEDLRVVERLLNAVGKAFALPEMLLDAVTGLSGSGPAYIFVLIEALSDAGVRVGLPRDVATQLAAQTVFGAAKMLLETGLHPAVLKDQVASPGGTTMAGLHALERGGFRAALIDAVEAATNRSVELGRLEPQTEVGTADGRR